MTKAELIQRCEELGIDHEPLTNNEQRQAAIDAKEAELAKSAQDSKEENPNTPKEIEDPGSDPETDLKPEEQDSNNPDTLSETEKPETKPNPDPKPEEQKTPKFFQDQRGRKWAFKKGAPETINIDGHPLTQAKILEDESIIAELVYGNCSFLTQINESNGR